MLYSRLIYVYVMISAGLLLAGSPDTSRAKEIINPHWTGKYCQECHVNEQPKDNNAQLQFNGDPKQICDRCHTKICITNLSHSSEVLYRDIPGYTVPSNWPLKNGKLSCLTCHDAIPPMYYNFPLKRTNAAFLRGSLYKNKADFCLTCHTKISLQKVNPHKQIDEKGNIIAQTCITCHKSVPDTNRTKDISGVTFKESLNTVCIGCHPAHSASHGPESGEYKLSDLKIQSLEKQKSALGVEIPLIEGRMFCGTCHNPHEKGVIQQAAAQRGAGEKYFLRLPGGYELCVSCHYRKTLKNRTRQINQQLLHAVKSAPDVLISHKPYLENKCKSCHEITPEQRDKPKPLFLCFREGCHKPELIEKPFEHNKSILENCYACHESHVSGYGKLLRVNEETECYSCHPLLKNKNGKTILETDKDKSNKAHQAFAAYVRTSAVPVGDDCGFCHTMKHRANIGTMAPGTCSDCHLYVQKILRENSSQPLNVHQSFKEKLCSKCHDPHASTYQYQLKNPPETYKKTVNR